jgi:hypothetical protein
MANVQSKSREAELYEEIYKNVKMGADSTVDMIKRLSDGDLKAELGRQVAQYEALAHEAKTALLDMGETPREEGLMTRMSAKAGVMMNTMIDSTPSHIAQMVIEGCAMGTSDLIKKINECERQGGEQDCEKARKLADRAIAFEEDCAEKMKAYL